MSLLKCSRFSCGAPCGTSLPHSELWLIDVLFSFMSQSYPMTNDYWFHVRFSCPRSGGHKFAHTTAPSRKGEIRTPAPRGFRRLSFALPACRLAILLNDKYVLSLAWRPPSLNQPPPLCSYWIKRISSSKKIDVRLISPNTQRRALG